jgi:hypothetical protein
MSENACPTCGANMQVTGRVPRGFNTTGAAGGRLEPVLGYCVRGWCDGCGTLWTRAADYPDDWSPGG